MTNVIDDVRSAERTYRRYLNNYLLGTRQMAHLYAQARLELLAYQVLWEPYRRGYWWFFHGPYHWFLNQWRSGTRDGWRWRHQIVGVVNKLQPCADCLRPRFIGDHCDCLRPRFIGDHCDCLPF